VTVCVRPRHSRTRRAPDFRLRLGSGPTRPVVRKAFAIVCSPGLVSKLDYIADLGATAIWLLPFYPSPRLDDGYDISDYRAVHPDYGTMADLRHFINAAHTRGIHVITELVINHTSDRHPWFQRARRAKPGSAARDFYVWSDNDQKYAGTRIIFLDTERSNWTWDPVAGAYFWHRFYSHQPDLNYDNPRVLKAMLGVMRYWLELGVDGFRLNAVPYLIEREGTNNENLPETHAILRHIRAELDATFPGRMLLAEANQWPEYTKDYFGDGDECHMAFHFPLMPRIYMAIGREDGRPDHASGEPAQWWPQAATRSRDACRHPMQPSPVDGEKAPARRSIRGPRLDAGPFCKGQQKRGEFRNAWLFRLRFPGGSC
jgi:trehalose synthase